MSNNGFPQADSIPVESISMCRDAAKQFNSVTYETLFGYEKHDSNFKAFCIPVLK
jgi:hypothetical protein